MNLADHIKQFRAKNGLSQKDFAKLLGISAVSVCRYETIGVRPRLPLLAKMADILEVDFDILFKSLNPLQFKEHETKNLNSLLVQFLMLSKQEKLQLIVWMNRKIANEIEARFQKELIS